MSRSVGIGLMFQHTAARRRLDQQGQQNKQQSGFNTQPPEGGWKYFAMPSLDLTGFNTQPPEGGWTFYMEWERGEIVSTHSRPKAAGSRQRRPCTTKAPFQHTAARRRLGYRAVPQMVDYGFNTQPPEGGWYGRFAAYSGRFRFNTQPPEGGWGHGGGVFDVLNWFQHTAARRRLGIGKK